MDFTQRISKKATGMTNDALAESVRSEGYDITGEGVRQWRTGATRPRSLEAVTALERALDITDGSLRDLLGWRSETSVEQRVTRLEETLRAHGITLVGDEPARPDRDVERDRLAAAVEIVDAVEDDRQSGTEG